MSRFLRNLCATVILASLSSFALAIDTPVNVRGQDVGSATARWDWSPVNGAVSYSVIVDGVPRGNTNNTFFQATGMWVGDHSLTVRAVDANGSQSDQSLTAKIFVSSTAGSAPSTPTQATPRSSDGSRPQAPTGLQGSDIGNATIRWQWSSVSGAVRYNVVVDGQSVGDVTGTSYDSNNLWVGEHSLTVKAINADGESSEQSATLKVNVSSTANSAAVAPPTAAPAPTIATSTAPAGSTDSGLIDPASWGYPEVYQKPGYELSFSDEFNGNTINTNRWHTQLRWDGEFNGERYEYRVINGEEQFYVNPFSSDQAHRDLLNTVYNPFEFNGSRLAIRAVRNPLRTHDQGRTFGPLNELATQQQFLSGALGTYEKFSQLYGYYEARIKIPSHVGTFPAFWLYHERRRATESTQRTEIDIMENLGHAPWYIYNSFHFFKNVTATYGGDANFVRPSPSGQIFTGTDYSQNYHVYAVEWEPGRIRYFIDGQQVSELYSGEVNYEPLYVILNLAIGGFWTNFPENAGGLGRNSDAFFPNQNDLNTWGNPALEIDYVRVYRRR